MQHGRASGRQRNDPKHKLGRSMVDAWNKRDNPEQSKDDRHATPEDIAAYRSGGDEMTRRDFERIARTIRNLDLPEAEREHVARRMAATLAESNPAFKPQQFYRACGLDA